jgi:hypothetical protein
LEPTLAADAVILVGQIVNSSLQGPKHFFEPSSKVSCCNLPITIHPAYFDSTLCKFLTLRTHHFLSQMMGSSSLKAVQAMDWAVFDLIIFHSLLASLQSISSLSAAACTVLSSGKSLI